MAEFDNLKVKDQLGRPDYSGIFVKKRKETLIIEDNTLSIVKQSLGNSWIVGSSTNGLVGTNTGTVGGGQQVVGASSRTEVVQAVINPGKIYRERFGNDYYMDDGETTADWGSGELDFTDTEIAQTNSIAYNDGTVTKCTISVTESAGDTDDLTVTATVDGTNWESITLGTEHTFSNTGTNLKVKIVAAGSVTLTYLRVNYS